MASNKYQKQWEAIEQVIQLLDHDWIAEGCLTETNLDCHSCEALLARKILKDIQQEYYELADDV